MLAGLAYYSFYAQSRVILKYGSWSIAAGIKQGTVLRSPKMCGNELLKAGAACTGGKANLPTLSDSLKPKMPLI
jgi:hypothetical protein